jgi:serine protease Do
VTAQLKDHGNVRRGWLGVKIQAVTPEIAQSLGLDSGRGALVTDVTAGSPAAKAGLHQGDVILAYEGKAIKTMRALPGLVAATRAGTDAKVQVWRDGREKTLTVKIGKLTPEQVATAEEQPRIPGSGFSKFLGADLAALDDDAKAKLNLAENAKGVVISKVDPEGRAAGAGLRPGDVIQKVGSIPVAHPSDIDKAFAKTKNNAVLLLVNRNGENLFVGVKRADA